MFESGFRSGIRTKPVITLAALFGIDCSLSSKFRWQWPQTALPYLKCGSIWKAFAWHIQKLLWQNVLTSPKNINEDHGKITLRMASLTSTLEPSDEVLSFSQGFFKGEIVLAIFMLILLLSSGNVFGGGVGRLSRGEKRIQSTGSPVPVEESLCWKVVQKSLY